MIVRNVSAELCAIAMLGVCYAAQPTVVDDARLAAAASSDQWLTIGCDYARRASVR
jgi:hypothetical protein